MSLLLVSANPILEREPTRAYSYCVESGPVIRQYRLRQSRTRHAGTDVDGSQAQDRGRGRGRQLKPRGGAPLRGQPLGRRERNCRRTLSAAFSMTYEPHKSCWKLPGESWGSYAGLHALQRPGGPVQSLRDVLRTRPLAGRQHERRGARDPPNTRLPQCGPGGPRNRWQILVPPAHPRTITSEAGRSRPYPRPWLGHRWRSAKARPPCSDARDAP
jgi:hypothetical protein